MRWIAKAACLVDDVVLEWEFDAPDGYTAETEAYQWARNSSVADSGSVYVVPSDDQPDEEKCYLVQGCSQRFCVQKEYCDTLEDAIEQAGELGNYYEFVEVLYGWPGHWELLNWEGLK